MNKSGSDLGLRTYLFTIVAGGVISLGILAFVLFVATKVVHQRFDHYSKPDIQLVKPACKICHCGKGSCHRECGEDAMCTMRCEGLCRKTK